MARLRILSCRLEESALPLVLFLPFHAYSSLFSFEYWIYSYNPVSVLAKILLYDNWKKIKIYCQVISLIERWQFWSSSNKWHIHCSDRMKIWQKVHVSIVIYQLSKQNAIKRDIWFGMKLDTLNYFDARLFMWNYIW